MNKTCGRACSYDSELINICGLFDFSKNSREQFLKCPLRISTMIFIIGNDNALYSFAMKNNFWFLHSIGFNEEDRQNIINNFKMIKNNFK